VLSGVGGEGAEGFEVGPGVEPLAHGGGVLAFPVVEAKGDVGASAEKKAEDEGNRLQALLGEVKVTLENGKGAVFACNFSLEFEEARRGEGRLAENADAVAEDGGFRGEALDGVELGEDAGAERAAEEGLEAEEHGDVADEEGGVPVEG